LPDDEAKDWPSLGKVRSYVSQVRAALDNALEQALISEEGQSGREFSLAQLLQVAIEHRLMHAETLAYMLHQLPFEQKVGRSYAIESHQAIPHQMIEIPAGNATLGLPREDVRFGWDNEFEQHTVSVPAFAVDRFMVSNGQYLEFLAAGGYDNRAFWDEAGWNWKAEQKVTHPVFWKRRGDGWYLRTMFNDIPLPLDWPVYVSHAEASAYARWARKALPTEAQWHRAAFGTTGATEREYPWGSAPPQGKHGNFDFRRWDPAAVYAHPDGDSAFGVSGLLGNGWEWTSTEFAPFAGFEPFEFYRGYSADFFDGKHFVMKGGSPRTAACMLRRSFRNWFQPHYQYVYAGFRCVSK
jgi:ergothioneine biosynthesis protein EgtB